MRGGGRGSEGRALLVGVLARLHRVAQQVEAAVGVADGGEAEGRGAEPSREVRQLLQPQRTLLDGEMEAEDDGDALAADEVPVRGGGVLLAIALAHGRACAMQAARAGARGAVVALRDGRRASARGARRQVAARAERASARAERAAAKRVRRLRDRGADGGADGGARGSLVGALKRRREHGARRVRHAVVSARRGDRRAAALGARAYGARRRRRVVDVDGGGAGGKGGGRELVVGGFEGEGEAGEALDDGGLLGERLRL